MESEMVMLSDEDNSQQPAYVPIKDKSARERIRKRNLNLKQLANDEVDLTEENIS